MDFTLPADVIREIAAQASAIAELLAPVGAAMAYSFIGLAIIMMGLSIATSGGVGLVGLAEMLLWGCLALAMCNNWGAIISGCLDTSDEALRIFGIDGPAALFQAAGSVADRIAQEPLGWSFSISGTAGALFRSVMLAISIPIIVIGLCIPGLLALLAQVSLILGAAAAPLLVPGIAWSLTRPLAFGALNFMVMATLRIIVLSLVSVVFAQALLAQLSVPGTDEAITMTGLAGLWLTALLALLAGFSANSIAGSLVGHGVGSLGLGSFAGPMGAVSAVGGAAGGAMAAAGSAAKAGGAAAGRAAGAISSRSSGAFP